MTELTDVTFWGFIRSHPRVVVQFWAPWNAVYDAALRARIEDCLRHYGDDSVAFGRINADEAPRVSAELRVMNLPAIGYFSDGRGDVEIGLRDALRIAEKLKGL